MIECKKKRRRDRTVRERKLRDWENVMRKGRVRLGERVRERANAICEGAIRG